MTDNVKHLLHLILGSDYVHSFGLDRAVDMATEEFESLGADARRLESLQDERDGLERDVYYLEDECASLEDEVAYAEQENERLLDIISGLT